MGYSLDLQIRAAHYYKTTKSSLRETANIFYVGKSSVKRWNTNYNTFIHNNDLQSEKICKKQDDNTSEQIKHNQRIIQFLKNSLDQNPFQSLYMLKDKILEKFNISRSIKSISNYLKIIRYSKKKIVRRFYNKSLKEHIIDRKNFKNKIKNINLEDIICVDESGILKDIYSKYGWCHKSKRLISNISIKDLPKKFSLIMAIMQEGVIYHELHMNTAINTDIFEEFIQVICSLYTGKYILMDNVAFHKSKRIKEAIENSGNYVLFIPPYSPDFNPVSRLRRAGLTREAYLAIEEVFSKLKSYIRRYMNPLNLHINVIDLINNFCLDVIDLHNYYTHAFI